MRRIERERARLAQMSCGRALVHRRRIGRVLRMCVRMVHERGRGGTCTIWRRHLRLILVLLSVRLARILLLGMLVEVEREL